MAKAAVPVAARKAALQAKARGGADGTCRWKAPRAFGIGCGLDGRLVKRVLAPWDRPRDAGEGTKGRQGVPASWLIGPVRGGQCPREQRVRDTGRPFGVMGLAAAGGAASTASPLRVEEAGNGQSTSLWTVAFGKSSEGSGGRAGQVAAVGRVRARSLGVACSSGYS
jgi:hypothetical protein